MSLIRFLSSGSRGLTKGAPAMGRYQLPSKPMIPEFGSVKNPFVEKTLPPQVESSPEAGVTARAAPTQAAPPSSVSLLRRMLVQAAHMASDLVKLWRLFVLRLKPLSARISRVGQRVRASALRRLFRRRPRTLFARSMAAPSNGPVQGELSLEKVRVVRNDLTDTDYEVVYADTATASPVKDPPQTVAVPAASRPLDRLAERLFSQRAD